MKELWLFTTRYPFGLREAFLENEIPILCQRFDRVVIFPEHADGPLRALPSNAEVRLPIPDPFAVPSGRVLLASLPLLLELMRSLWEDKPSFKALRAQWPSLRSRMAQFIHRAHVFSEKVMPQYDPDHVTVYCYWTHDWTTVLGLVKKRDPRLRFFSRAHGFDVYEAQNQDRWIPFRAFQLQALSTIYCASRSALSHLQERHPQRRELFELARLGTTDHGLGPFDPAGPLKVVSCSFLIPRKRVLRLIEALALVNCPVQWTHFGGGDQEEGVVQAARRLPQHIRYELRGMTLNARIMRWYCENPVDVFVHLSELEGGVVVAIQEATSFGIPVIAADSGGVRDLVDARTGVLLGQDPQPREVADLLDGFNHSPMAKRAFREGVHAAWATDFEANAVYNRFVDRVIRLD